MSCGKCKACGAEIQWVKLRKLDGTIVNHPVDAQKKKGLVMAVKISDMSLDQFSVDGTQPEIVADYDGDTPILNFRHVFTSHYATCPNANDFRGKKK